MKLKIKFISHSQLNKYKFGAFCCGIPIQVWNALRTKYQKGYKKVPKIHKVQICKNIHIRKKVKMRKKVPKMQKSTKHGKIIKMYQKCEKVQMRKKLHKMQISENTQKSTKINKKSRIIQKSKKYKFLNAPSKYSNEIITLSRTSIYTR